MLNTLNETDPEELAVVLNSMNARVRKGHKTRLNPQQRARVAFLALRAIAKQGPDTAENWDGTVWWERMDNQEDGSLADYLLREGDATEHALEWLKTVQK